MIELTAEARALKKSQNSSLDDAVPGASSLALELLAGLLPKD